MRIHKAQPENTLESGHTMLPQYLGMPSGFADPRPNPRVRRCMSEDDDPERARFVDQVVARIRRQAQ